MRLFEILLFSVVLIVLIARLIPVLRHRVAVRILPFAAVLLIPIHLIVEGYRWQMVPVFVFTLGLAVVSLVQIGGKRDFLIKNKIVRTICVVLSFLLFAGSFIFPLLLPVVDLPEPDGPYGVGTVRFRMIDADREESFTEDPGDVRNLLVTAWYPADVEKGSPVRTYWDKEGVTGKAYSVNAGMGTFWYSHLRRSKTNSHPEAPVSAAQASFPVIIYSPSFYGLNTENTMLCESLASHGYMVFSIAHSYETIVSVYPDGEAVPGYLDHVFDIYDAHADAERQLYQDYENTEDMGEKAELVKQILTIDESSTFLIKVRTEDTAFVLDEIGKLNDTEGLFHGKVDMDRAGILGWSFGGATAEEACMTDSRFKAGVNIDGWPYGEQFATEKTIGHPFMMIRSESEDDMEDIITGLVYQKMGNAAYALSVQGAEHVNFWDFPLFFDVYKYIGYWGPIGAERMLAIHNTFTVGFFDKYLKGADIDLRDSVSAYPEVTVEAKNIE